MMGLKDVVGAWPRVIVCVMLFGLMSSGCSSCSEGELTTRPVDPEERMVTPGGMQQEANDYFMVAAGATNHLVDVGSDVKLGVYLYSKSSGGAVNDQPIRYEVIEGVGVATLAAANAGTDPEGLAEVTLRAQDNPGQVTVKASHPLANEVIFTIDVLAAATSGINVKLTNTNPNILALKDIDVRLYPGVGYSCNEFLPLRQQTEPLEIRPAPNVATQVEFGGLNPSKKYIVTAIARGAERGQIAASGCVEDIRLSPDEVSDIELGLVLIPINPVGRYDATSYWDFTQAIEDSGPIGSTIVRILNIFQNPGQAIYDEIINLINYAVGGIISGAIDSFLSITGLDDDFQDLINNTIENNEVLRRVRDAGRDVRDVIANLQVSSILTVGKVNSSYEFTGTDNWLGVTVYWRWNCADNAPADCGAIPLLVDGAGDVADLGILSSQWNGRVVAYDDLQIDQHPLTLRYGRLIIYILNDIIIPELTNNNATSLSEAFAYWIGCDDLAVSLTGSDREVCALGACVYADDVAGFCSSAITTVFGFADALVRSLEFDIGLRVGGDAKLIEEDSDGFVDRIVDGTYEGFMTTADGGQGGSAAPISATWEAVRIDFQSNNM